MLEHLSGQPNSDDEGPSPEGNKSVDQLTITVRALDFLRKEKVTTVDELMNRTPDELLSSLSKNLKGKIETDITDALRLEGMAWPRRQKIDYPK